MRKVSDLTHAEVIAAITYDPHTGELRRRVRSGKAAAGALCNTVNWKGYIEFPVNNVLVRAHRLAFFIVNGRWPIDQIDHIDGNKQNNSLANLREVDNRTNCENKKSRNKNNTSGFPGVVSRGKKWEARIGCSGKLLYLGLFETPQLAHAAYIESKKQLHKGYQP